jgi:protein-S-isoprenylcysteine O-methyltransferase Ste14
MFDFLTGLVGLVYFLSISVATRQHFRSQRYPLGMYVISVLSLVGLATFLVIAFRAQLIFAGASLALIVAAQGLFFWAVRHSRNRNLTLAMDTDMQSESIIRTGPWRYMRHPFYASYMIFWLACALATQHIISVIVFLTLSAIYTYSALREERVLSSGPLRKDYIEYRETVGFFYPRLPLRG